MKIMEIVNDLVELSPRFAKGEEQAAKYIDAFLQKYKIPFIDQKFKTTVPYPVKVELKIDGKQIPAKNVGMESGKFISKDAIVSSLFWGENDFYYPQNINFNPHASKTVSMATYYKHPAIAIRRADVLKVAKAKKIQGETVVEPYSFTGHNFLVGNTKNPKTIIFTHYDCWETGAIDNASGTAVLMDIAVSNKELFKNNLLVIGGNEEISYDEPVYWGKGYRAFEDEYGTQLNKAQNIICIDGVGYSQHEWITDPEFMILALPLTHFNKYAPKISVLTGSFEKLMEVYHSNDDVPALLSEQNLLKAKKMLISNLK